MTPASPADTAASLPLTGLFRLLIDRGAALGVRDYLDVLRALQAGHGGFTLQRLRWLCVVLWARSEEDHRTINQWFEVITPLPGDSLATIDERLARISSLYAADAKEEPKHRHSPDGPAASIPAHPRLNALPTDGPSPRAMVSIRPESSGQGLGLPRLNACPLLADIYLLRPRPSVSMRQLALLWRRLRRTQRGGAGYELDLEASVRRRCEEGVLRQPAFRPHRRNTARLLVLADASPSMAPWRPFLQALEASLPHGRLGAAALRWFSNVPGSTLGGSAPMEAAEVGRDVLRRFAGASMLVVSDAGSARGGLSPRRVRRTRSFLAGVHAMGFTVAWINPMPQERWRGTSAERIAREGPVMMLPLDGANLLRAVDILRGFR